MVIPTDWELYIINGEWVRYPDGTVNVINLVQFSFILVISHNVQQPLVCEIDGKQRPH
jgi:hypothetical protein